MAGMSKRDKVGLAILISLFVFFAVILVITIDRPKGPVYGWEDNVLIQQRMKNLENR